MEVLSLSWATIFKVLSGVGIAYVIAPFLLVLRDQLLLKIIEKWIITKDLIPKIRLCESDRWQLNSKYSKKEETKIPVSGGDTCFFIDGQKVEKNKFDEYQSQKSFHQNRFQELDSKINLKHNWVIWLTKHYKLTEFESPIPKLKKKAYSQESGEE